MKLKLFKELSLAIDLGTVNTLISYEGRILLNQPSIVALCTKSKQLIAVGDKALLMHEKTNYNVRTLKPLRDGVIADFSAAEMMIKSYVAQVRKSIKSPFFSSFTILFSVPTCITDVEKRAVRDSGFNAGASEVFMVYEPVASAVGAGLDVRSPEGMMVVDIGGGTTQVALISLSGIVIEKSIKTAGTTFNSDILSFFKKQQNLLIGERTAEAVKIKLGLALSESGGDKNIDVIGKDLLFGIPKSVKIFHSDVISSFDKSLVKIEESILQVLDNTPPELASDLHQYGIHISGGGALLKGLKERLSERLGLKIILVEDPLNAVIRGASIILKDRERYASLIFQ
jgi:rod shape-determining protein MreB